MTVQVLCTTQMQSSPGGRLVQLSAAKDRTCFIGKERHRLLFAAFISQTIKEKALWERKNQLGFGELVWIEFLILR